MYFILKTLHVFAVSDTCVLTSLNSSLPPLVPQPLPATDALKRDPKLTRQTLPANNVYPHLGFIPVAPHLEGWFDCLRNNNSISSRDAFYSVQRGDCWMCPPELKAEWDELECRLVHLCSLLRHDPVPSATLDEEDYPLPSTFGYKRIHKSKHLANACMERSRDAFFPLIARVSYFIFFLQFPAVKGPLLRWKTTTNTKLPISAKAPVPGQKRPPPETSSSSKRLRTEDQTEDHAEDVTMGEASNADVATDQTNVDGLSTEDREALEFESWWKGKEAEAASTTGYEDGLYWQYLLALGKVPPHAISSISQSELANFTSNYPRTGYWVRDDFIASKSLRQIYRTTHCVPVWVEWISPYNNQAPELSDVRPSQQQIAQASKLQMESEGKGKGKAVDHGWGADPEWENAAPDDEVAAPSGWSLDPPPPPKTPPPPRRKKVNGQYVDESRDEFFARMALARDRSIASESALQRQSRESRARNAQKQICPSTRRTGTTIYKWDEDEQLRELVHHRAWSTEWRLYADTQRLYHDFCDQWDLCEALDPGARPDLDSEEEDIIDEEMYPPAQREPTPPPPYPPTSPAPPPISIASGSPVWGGGLQDESGPVSHRDRWAPLQEILWKRFGFTDSTVPCPRDPSIHIHPDTKLLRVLGYLKLPIQETLSPNAIYFISVLLSRQLCEGETSPLPEVIHDTTLLPTIAPNYHLKLSCFYLDNEQIYIISSRLASSREWCLAITSATTALECMRSTHTNLAELISFLVQSGRAFGTHRHRDQIPLPVYRYPPPIVRSSYRSSTRLPTAEEDYAYYVDTQTSFLSLPRGRAAILRGGIVWRLAIEYLGDRAEHFVAHGPSDDVLRFGRQRFYNGGEFWDDDLTETEMDLICGVYKLYSK